jgi:hypothetical protein
MTYTVQEWADHNANFPASAARISHIDKGVKEEEERALTSEASEKARAESAEKSLNIDITTEEEARKSAVEIERERAEAAEALKAPLASPALTGNPTAPTQAEGDSSTRLATTAFAHEVAATAAAAIVQTSSETTVGEVEGNIEPAMPANTRLAAFTYTQKAEATVKLPTGVQAGFSQVLVRVKQPAAGGKKLKTTGVTWNGGEPVWSEVANAVNDIWMFTVDGATWEGEGPEKGANGAQGPEGYVSTNMWLPEKLKIYSTTGSSETEDKQAIFESFPRDISGGSTLLLTSGTPIVGPVSGKANQVIHGLAWHCTTIEGTPANRTHLWIALFNAAGEIVAVSPDYTSSTNTPMVASTLHGLKFSVTYTPEKNEPLWGALCEVMSSTNPITVGIREGNATVELPPALCGTLAAAETTPPTLKAAVTFSHNLKIPYLAAW